MNKKLLDIFVDPKILLKEAIEKDLKEIEKFLKKKIRIVHQFGRLDKKELKCVREIKKHLMGFDADIVLGRIKTYNYKYYVFYINTFVDSDDLKELLRVFASNTISAFINQKTQVECNNAESNGCIIECPDSYVNPSLLDDS